MPNNDPKDPALRVAGQIIGQPEPGKCDDVFRMGTRKEFVALPCSLREDDRTSKTGANEDAEGQHCPSRHRMEVVLLFDDGAHHRGWDEADIKEIGAGGARRWDSNPHFPRWSGGSLPI